MSCHDEQPAMDSHQKRVSLKVRVSFSPALDTSERLRRLAAILLGPGLGDKSHQQNAQGEDETTGLQNQNAVPD